MRVIKNPNPIGETIITCQDCKCEFSYNKNDIKIRSGNNGVIGPGFSGYCYRWINCPNCGKQIVIE